MEAAPTVVMARSSRSSVRRRRWGAASTRRVDERGEGVACGAGRVGAEARPIRGMPTGEVTGAEGIVAAASCEPGDRSDVMLRV